MLQCHRVWAIQGTNYTLPTQGLRILAWLAYVLVSFDCRQEFVNPFYFILKTNFSSKREKKCQTFETPKFKTLNPKLKTLNPWCKYFQPGLKVW
jgi:hypothetical protein